MEKIYGKIKDVHQLIQAAFELARIDGVSPGIQSSIADLNSRLTNKIDGGHFQKNIRKLVEDLYADTKMHEVGINFSSPYLDGLSMLLYKVPFVQKFGLFTGEFIFNKSKKTVENYKYRLPNPGPVQNVPPPERYFVCITKVSGNVDSNSLQGRLYSTFNDSISRSIRVGRSISSFIKRVV